MRLHVPNLEKRIGYFQMLADRSDRLGIANSKLYETLAAETGLTTEEIERQIYDAIRLHQDVLGIMKRLHAHYKVGILTNADDDEIKQIVRHYSLSGYFDGLLVSSAVGVIKPEPEIFELACEQLEVAPEEAVFVDDNQINVDGAERVGLTGILFTDAENLEHELGQLGMLS